MLQALDRADFTFTRGRLTDAFLVSSNGLMMPSTADELAALRRIDASRCAGSRSQALDFDKEDFMRDIVATPHGVGNTQPAFVMPGVRKSRLGRQIALTPERAGLRPAPLCRNTSKILNARHHHPA